jgi:UDP-3-O-[3-hydroxymyristoyl] N-acetylglucosamine deacetylase
LILEAGIRELPTPRSYFVITDTLEIGDGNRYVKAVPHPTLKISCTIEFGHALIGKQTFDFELSDNAFTEDISRARTFGFYHEVEHLRRYGLAKGATLDTGIAIDKDVIMNSEGLRFKDEFVRHKLLDCIGDFSLLGMPIIGHIQTFKSGHAFNHAFIRELFTKRNCWETRILEDDIRQDASAPKTLAI